MKKLVLALCVVGFSATGVAAQKLRADFGAKAGWNITGLALSPSGKLVGLTYNNRSGYHVGVYGSVRFKKIAIQPEIIYSRQGQNFSYPGYSNLSTNLKYINIPVIIKYYPVGGLNFQVGPQFGFLAGATGDLIPYHIDLINGNSFGASIRNQDIKNHLKSSDFSICFGAGIDLPGRVGLTLRYNLGVSDINKNSGGSYPTDGNGDKIQPSISTAKTQNQVFQMSVSYRFYKIGK